MRLVYISGPITRGNQWANGARADDAMLTLMRVGIAVHNPMLTMWAGACRAALDVSPLSAATDSHYLRPLATAHAGYGGLDHAAWLAADKEIVSRCDAVLRLPGESTGADIETAHATACGIPVFHDLGGLIRHFAEATP
jgi:hypothetical protein